MRRNEQYNGKIYGAYRAAQYIFCLFKTLRHYITTHTAGCADRRNKGVSKRLNVRVKII
jgi:hypothetical protein